MRIWPALRRRIARYQELALAATFLAVAGYEALEMWALERPSALSLLIHAVQVGAILAATAVAVRAWQRKTAHQEALTRLVERVTFAQDEERRRVAYELHDGISPLVVSAKQHLDTCSDLWARDPERARAQLETGIARLSLAITETRRVLGALRPAMLVARGLAPAARESLHEAAGETGWAIGFREDLGDARLAPVVETAAFRILQEALANVRKHARAERVDVELHRDAGWLHLAVRDDGIGLPAAEARGRHGLGLVSMQERAELLGGTCTIERAGARGTCVRVRLPLPAGS